MSHAKTPSWMRGGKFEDIVWIGKDVLAWCSGLYIVFLHVAKRREVLRWCWNKETGDGACCISGHVFVPVFAFAERSLKPRIFVHSYPSMAKISECFQECDSGYLATAFTNQGHLVSLCSYPNFSLIVWRWRTGEKIAMVDTPIRDEVGQRLRITLIGRTLIGQVGKTCGDLLTWELDDIGGLLFLKDHEVRLPRKAKAYGIDWCPEAEDPLLAITDQNGHIYLSNYDGSNVRLIVLSKPCGLCNESETPAICWFQNGIILRTSFCQIHYFRRDRRTDTWKKQWFVTSFYKPHILIAHPIKTDWLFYYTLEGYLMQITFSEEHRRGVPTIPTIHKYLYCGGMYRFVDFVHPWCHHLVATDNLKDLIVFDSYQGSKIARLDLDMDGAVSAQASHPDYPLIAVTSDHGEMVLVGIADPEKPMILARFRLHCRPLDIVKFSYSGKYVITTHKDTGYCYCVNVYHDKPWQVIAMVQTRRRLIDVMLHDDRSERHGHLKLLALYVKFESCTPVGDEILVYDVSKPDHMVVDEICASIMLPALYTGFCYAPGDVPRLLIGSPYLSRQLHVLKLNSTLTNIELLDIMLSGHHVRLARIFTDRRWIVTCAYDGLVIVRDETINRIAIVVPTHHRFDSGNTKAIVGHEGNVMVSLGHDGSLVAMRLHMHRKEVEPSLSPTEAASSTYQVDHDYYKNWKHEILADYASLDSTVRASLTTVKPRIPDTDKSWEEWQQDMQWEWEKEIYAEEKAAIRKDLEVLKTTVKELIDINETLPDIQRLPISAFDLDRSGHDQKLKAGKDEREEVRLELEYLCESTDIVAAWIKTTFWDPPIVQGRSIFSFCGEIEVTNYPLLEQDPHFHDYVDWAQFHREVERVIYDDTFRAWHPYTEEQLKAELSKKLTLFQEHRVEELLEEEELEIDPVEVEEMRALDGMTTHKFVEQSIYYYKQMESYGFAQTMLENYYLMHDCTKLHTYFNKLFDDMFMAKKQEMALVREKSDRIHYIDSELKLMFGEQVPHLPADPEWHSKEQIETIIQVREDEIKAKPYISPSELIVLKQAEEERARLALLADDFRERALMWMMDGVLEIRWEDTIKLDVRKPACMLEKQPEQYTIQDILLVKKYEADVETLRQERERYKRMLEADYVKLSGIWQERIEKFDNKVNDLFELKLKVDAAINQLKLRHVRGRLQNIERIKSMKEDDRLKREKSKMQQRKVVLEEQLRQLRQVHHDMTAQYEALCSREKMFTKKLAHNFTTLSKSNIEHLERQYKRRPKVHLKNVSYDLNNLARYVVDRVKPSYLPTDCMDYLKILESLDTRPDGLPPSIDAHHWHHLVRLRHQKIDVELKIRAQQLDITAVERTIGVFDKKIEACKSRVDQLVEELKLKRQERMIREQDHELQLVLKRGQVEINMQGECRDAANAVLITRKEIVTVNEHIRAAGVRKLQVLKRIIDFRHKMATTEWQHRCLKMRFRELKEDLRFVEEATVTRDMRIYLRRQARGLRDDKTAVQFEKEIDNARKALEKALSREVSKLDNIREKIVRIRKRNAELDRAIMEVNVKRWELEYQRDLDEEARQNEHVDRKMRMFRQRAELVRKVQDNYIELLALQTEHELLRMRAYPTLDYYETLDDKQPQDICQ